MALEDRPDYRRAAGLGHELKPPPRNRLTLTGMKRFSENGARPVLALGGVTPQPFGRLGALVFQPNPSESLCWASLRAPTRIVGCALGYRPTDTRWENVSPENRRASSGHPFRSKNFITPSLGRANTNRLSRPRPISLSLGTVVAEHTPRTPGSSTGSCRGRMLPPSTDGLSAQVARLQSPILSAATTPYTSANAMARSTTTMT